MKILYIVNTYPDKKNPAAQPFVKAQIESVQREGVNVFTLNIKGNQSKWNYLNALFRLRKIERERCFDIIHGHYVYSGFIAAMQCRAVKVISFMGSDLYGTFDHSGNITAQGYLDIVLSKLVQLMTDGIIVKSPEMKEILIKKNKAIVLPNGVDFNKFKKIPKNDAKNRLKINVDKKYVLFAGDFLSPRKGYAILIDAVNLLKQSHSEYELLLVHNMPHENVPLYMSAAEVLALPSLKEGSPNVVKEAIACDLPVVATDVGDIREIIGAIPGCYLVERTAVAFADAIYHAASSKQTFRGRSHIEHLRMENIAQRLITFYERLISEKRKRTAAA